MKISSPTTPKCFICKSDLIHVKTWTEMIPGSLFPQTSTLYHCSNKSCQEEKDKQEGIRKEAVKVKEERIKHNAKMKEIKQTQAKNATIHR